MNHILISSLPMLVCLFWTATLLMEYVRNHRREILALSVFMTAAFLLYMGHYVFFTRQIRWIPVTDTVYRLCNLAVYPLYLIYMVWLTRHRPALWHMALLLLPSVLGGIAIGVLYSLMSPAETTAFVEDCLYGADASRLTGYALAQYWCHKLLDVVFGIQVVVVLMLGIRLIRQFRYSVSSYFADTEGRMLVGIRTVFVVLALTSIASFVANMVGRQVFTASTSLLSLPSLLFATMLFAIGYVGMTQDFSIQDFSTEDTPEPPAPSPSDRKQELLFRRIDQLVTANRLYLKPDLKVSDLAKQLNTNEKYISQAINTVLGQPFSEYINRQRILYANQLMKDQPDLLASEVAHRSGYGAVSSFYRNLKLYGKSSLTA